MSQRRHPTSFVCASRTSGLDSAREYRSARMVSAKLTWKAKVKPIGSRCTAMNW